MTSFLSIFLKILGLAKSGLGFALPTLSGPWGVFLSFLDALWNSSIGRVAIVGAGAFLAGWVWGFGHEHQRVTQIKAETAAKVESAIKSRDSEWKAILAAANAVGERKLKEALDAARNVAPIPDGADLIRLCRDSASCRGAIAEGQRVQAPKCDVVPKRHTTNH